MTTKLSDNPKEREHRIVVVIDEGTFRVYDKPMTGIHVVLHDCNADDSCRQGEGCCCCNPCCATECTGDCDADCDAAHDGCSCDAPGEGCNEESCDGDCWSDDGTAACGVDCDPTCRCECHHGADSFSEVAPAEVTDHGLTRLARTTDPVAVIVGSPDQDTIRIVTTATTHTPALGEIARPREVVEL